MQEAGKNSRIAESNRMLEIDISGSHANGIFSLKGIVVVTFKVAGR